MTENLEKLDKNVITVPQRALDESVSLKQLSLSVLLPFN